MEYLGANQVGLIDIKTFKLKNYTHHLKYQNSNLTPYTPVQLPGKY